MPSTEQKFGRDYYLLIVVQTFTSAAFYTIAPVLTKYLVGSGMTVALAGTVSGMISLTALVVRPFSGVLADRVNPKLLLMIFIPLLAVSTYGYSLTTSALPIFVFRVLNGIAFCLNGTTIIAFSCRFIPKSRMSEGIGYQGLGNVIASSVCPGIGIEVTKRWGYQATFAVAVAMALISLLFLMPVRTDRKRSESMLTQATEIENKAKKLRLGDIIAVSVLPAAFLAAMFSYSNGTVTNFLVLVTEENGLSEISMYYTTIAVAMVILRSFTGRLCDRYGIKFILVPAYIFTFLGMQIISRTTSTVLIAAAGILMAFGQGGGSPALLGHAVKIVGAERRGVATSTYYIFLDVFQGIAPIIGGALVNATGTYKSPFLMASGLLAFGLLLYLLIEKKVFRVQAASEYAG